jgi:hypothetical protein
VDNCGFRYTAEASEEITRLHCASLRVEMLPQQQWNIQLVRALGAPKADAQLVRLGIGHGNDGLAYSRVYDITITLGVPTSPPR